MKKLLNILIGLLFIISLIPPITVAAPLTIKYVNKTPGSTSIIAYQSTGTYNVYVYGMGSAGGYDLAVLAVDNTGATVLNTTIPANVAYGVADAAANDTGILIAYHYYTNREIYLYWIGFDGTTQDIGYLTSTAEDEDNPVVAFGGNYWLVGYRNDTADNFTVVLLDKNFNVVYTNSSISLGTYGGVDYRERAFYDPVTGKFYVVVKAYNSATSSYDLALVIVDPTTMKTDLKFITATSGASEAYPSFGLMYRRFYAQLLSGGGYLLVVYGYYSGSTNIDGVIVDLSTLTTTPVTLSTEGGDSNFYPWIAASSTEWLVVWSYNNNIYARFVYPNGTLSALMTLGVGVFGYVTAVHNGQDYTVVYGNQSTGDYDLYAMRLATDGKRGSPFLIAGTPGVNEDYEYPLVAGTLHTVLYYNEGDGNTYVALFDLTEVPEPTQIPTKLTVTFTKNDGGDGYLEAGDSVTVSGKLIDEGTGLGVAGKTITATLYYYVFYDSRVHHDIQEVVATESNVTGTDGSYTITITIPSNVISGTYFVKVDFTGDDVYAAQSNTTAYFLIFKTKPVPPTWATIPADIAIGPALWISNGQVVITDPAEDERTDNIPAAEQADLDVRSVIVAFDSNYLYIKADFAGDVTPTGDVVPALAFAIDFTPDVYDDGWGAGYTGNFKLPYPWDSQTHINNSRAWDIAFTITPVYPQVYSDDGKIPIFMYVAYYDGTDWKQYKEVLVGYADFTGGTITAYLPLDAVRAYNNHLATSGLQKIMLFSAVFAVNVSEVDLVSGTPYANWYDVPGALTAGITPANYLSQGYNESYDDDRKVYGSKKSWELDTRFVLTMDLDNNKFIGYTETWFKNSTITAGSVTYSSTRVKAFVGAVKYDVVLKDADNPLYYVYGKTINMLVNNTAVASATTNALGLAEITYTWSSTDWKKIAYVNFTFAGDTDYNGSATPVFTTKVLYLINITSVTYNWTDNDHDLMISRGDTLTITATVKVWDGSAWVTAPAGVGIKVYLHSPAVYLGTAYTDSTGVATLVYTFTGNEYLLGTGHTVTLSGDGDTSWSATFPGYTLSLPQNFWVLPAPEPPVLPVLLLAALLLFLVVFKKRK